ncbi:MAG TPA: NAD(P)-dependent oxidoreductase [Gammaproteobacteria bacterium]|nr:NAD(P)-dependent oxidoreductase [Gammaproteobacteria bacterium]
MHGVFLDLDTVSREGDVDLAPLRKVLTQLRTFAATPVEQVASRVADAEVVITNKVKLGAAALAQFARVRLVCVAATGTNNIDLEAARARGIAVNNVPAYSTLSVVQQVFAFVLALTQHLKEYETLLQQGAWRRAPQFTLLDYPIRELAGKTFGILGYGDTGRAVARVAEALGMQVLIAARNSADTRPGRLPLAQLLPQVDVLSIHVPLLPDTRHLIGRAELARMKRDALLINCARGGIVDESALAEALRAHRLGGAGVDVLSEEPPVRGNALLEPGIPNLIVTPHTAWATREARQRVVSEMALNIAAFAQGQPRNRVA